METIDNAKQVLQSFITAMKEYEIERKENAKKYGSEYILEPQTQQKVLNQIIEIQERFLSKKALSLKQDRRTTLTYRKPPEFDQSIVSENLLTKNKVEILTCDNTDPHSQYKYTLVFEDGEWKLDKVAYSWMKWKATRQNF